MHCTRAKAVGLIALVGAALCGCDETVIHWVDPPVKLSGTGSDATSGPPELVVGFSTEDGFAPLDEAPALVVIYGLQGGTWVMPAVRTTGLGGYPRVACHLDTAAGERVGDAVTQVRLYLATDGALEVQSFPIAIHHAPPRQDEDVDDLAGNSASAAVDVVLVAP